MRGALAATAALFGDLAARSWAGDDAGSQRRGVGGRAALAVPLAAFEQYVKGLLADTPAAQVPLLTKALRIKPDYAAARIALWQAHDGSGRASRRPSRRVAPVGRGVAAVRWRRGSSGAVAHSICATMPPAWHTLAALHARAPSALVLNNMGVVRLRSAAPSPEVGPADVVLQPGAHARSARSGLPLQPGLRVLAGRRLRGGRVLAARGGAARARPTPAAHALLAQVLFAGGHAAEAARELALAQRLSAAFEGLDLKAGAARRRRADSSG